MKINVSRVGLLKVKVWFGYWCRFTGRNDFNRAVGWRSGMNGSQWPWCLRSFKKRIETKL